MKKNILIIDDEINARAGLKRVLEHLGCNVVEAASGSEGLDIFRKNKINLVITDLRMPGDDGMSVLDAIQNEAPEIPVILITAYGSGEAAKKALAKGAYDFISKPFDIDTIELVVKRALKLVDLKSENKSLKFIIGKKNALSSIVGDSPQIKHLFQVINQVAPTKSNVLIEGESGTGKELIARAIHDLSPRCNNAFVPLHCASFQENLLESELFGHEKGSFTGAVSKRLGRFELADKGTLFLDEVSTIQVKLLRVLQERVFERVGGTETIETDVRIVAATNMSLEKLIEEGKFREDLYYRLNVVSIKIPPLRERPDDIKLLINHFLDKFNRETGKNIIVSPFAEEIIESYSWPGNVRELENYLEKALIFSSADTLTLPPLRHRQATAGQFDPEEFSLKVASRRLEEEYIRKALVKTAGNRTQAAELLEVSLRSLMYKIKEYDID